MRYWLLSFALVGLAGFVACAAQQTERPTQPTELTSGFYGPGYGGNTAYGQTNGPSGEPTRNGVQERADGGILKDPISR